MSDQNEDPRIVQARNVAVTAKAEGARAIARAQRDLAFAHQHAAHCVAAADQHLDAVIEQVRSEDGAR